MSSFEQEDWIGIVLNSSFGGFSISDSARTKLGLGPYDNVNRFNPELVKLVENQNGDGQINGMCSDLYVEKMPKEYFEGPSYGPYNGTGKNPSYYHIEEYDGTETLKLNHDAYEKDQQLAKIASIVSCTDLSDSEKIEKISQCLNGSSNGM